MNEKTIINTEILFLSLRHKILVSALALALIGAVTSLVYVTGGIQYAFSHLVYIPIIMMAVMTGWKGALVAALISGVALGPFMPVDTDAQQMQATLNWLVRLLVLVIIGGGFGTLFDLLRSTISKTEYLRTHHQDSKLPNFSFYAKTFDKQIRDGDLLSMSLQINNFEQLIILLGLETYDDVMKNLYDTVDSFLPASAKIAQVDMRRFWVGIPKEDYKNVRSDFVNNLENVSFYGGNIPLYLDFSVGIAHSMGAKSPQAQFNQSDIAALHAKYNHLKYVVYHREHERDQQLLKRLGELPQAIENGDLFVMYQPIIEAKTKKIVSVEALIRWQYGQTVLEPVDFIPLAEETRIIDHITEWLVGETLSAYQAFSAIDGDIVMTINISQRNLFNPAFIERIRNTIKAADLNKGAFEMEMTESTLMLNRQLTNSFLESFRSIGVGAVLDDFGTGYSSLSLLKDLLVDKVKIDREFTKDMLEHEEVHYMIKTIISLAHYMDLLVIAEGVESEAIATALASLGCDYVQGYYYSKPLEYENIKQLLRSSKE